MSISRRRSKTFDEKLKDNNKPKVQQEFLSMLNNSPELGQFAADPEKANEQMCKYINFFANLMISSDRYLVEVLDKLEQ